MSFVRELEGRTAIVAEAGAGPGREIAARLAAAGARVLLAASDPDAGEAAAAAIRAEGGVAMGMPAPITSDSDWARVVETAERDLGKLDVLVVAAVEARPARAVELSLADFRGGNAEGLKGAFLAIRHAAPAMRRTGQGGSIAFVGTIAAKVGIAGQVQHAAVQGGLRMMAKAAALELGPERIRVNSIHVGLAGQSPLGAGPTAEDIAEAALFLASDRSVFMTGGEIVLDGGWSIQ